MEKYLILVQEKLAKVTLLIRILRNNYEIESFILDTGPFITFKSLNYRVDF